MAQLVTNATGRRVRIAIDGYTGAGKTSFGHELGHTVAEGGRPVFRASLDDFKRPWRDRNLNDRESGEGYYRNAQDFDAIRRLLLEPGSPTGTGLVALCSIDPITQVDHSSSVVELPDGGVLIVDGVFAFRPELNAHWDIRIWLHVDTELSLRRGAGRDAGMYGGEGAAEALHRDRYHGAEAIYLDEVDPVALADVSIDNSDFDRPRLLRAPN